MIDHALRDQLRDVHAYALTIYRAMTSTHSTWTGLRAI